MKIIKTKPETVKEKKYVEKIICDICKQEITDGNWECNDIKVEANIGNVWPEGDCRTLYLIDVCQNCFEDKLIPLIENTFDTKFREISSDERCELLE